jgi:ketosteroid isomerase-like protein
MDSATAQAWLDRYIAAWRSNDRADIRDLFSEDVRYRYHPFDDPIEGGRDGLVDSWLEDPDNPDAWEAEYTVYAVDGDRVVATGWSRYFAVGDESERLYHNCYLMEFDGDGRCNDFTEFYIRH